MFRTLILVLFFSSGVSSAQDDSPQTTFEYTKRVHEKLERLKVLGAENFMKEVDEYRSTVEKYIEHKKRVCRGEFSIVVLEEGGSPSKKSKKNKLSKQERLLCFRELKALQMTLVNNMFIARKRFLEFLHEKRVSELENARIDVIKSLQKGFSSTKR